MKPAWLCDGVYIWVNAKAAQCFILPLAPLAVNALVFVARLMVFACGVGRLCADNHIEATRNPHKWLKYDSCTVSALVLNAFALGESVNHTIQAHLFTPLLSALLSWGLIPHGCICTNLLKFRSRRGESNPYPTVSKTVAGPLGLQAPSRPMSWIRLADGQIIRQLIACVGNLLRCQDTWGGAGCIEMETATTTEQDPTGRLGHRIAAFSAQDFRLDERKPSSVR
jgi:hypothetical protein